MKWIDSLLKRIIKANTETFKGEILDLSKVSKNNKKNNIAK